MRDSMKIAAVVGAMAFVAWGVPACGGDDSSGSGGKKATGGTGGTEAGTGGTGATGGSSGSGGSGATGATGGSGGSAGSGIDCAGTTCADFSILGQVLAGCCVGTNNDKCGVDIPDLGAGIPSGCVELNQAGSDDTGCPPYSVSIGITLDFPGCCNTATSTCGNVVDLDQLRRTESRLREHSPVGRWSTHRLSHHGRWYGRICRRWRYRRRCRRWWHRGHRGRRVH